MDGIIRLTAAVNKVNVANPRDCLEEIKQILSELPAPGSDIVVFPSLALCSPSSGSLLLGSGLPQQCAQALEELLLFTRETGGYLLVGLPVEDLGRTVSAMAVLHRGEMAPLIPVLDAPPPLAAGSCSDNLASPEIVFACGRLRFCVLGCELSTLGMRAMAAASTGCELLILPTYSPVRAGLIDEVCRAAQAVSASTGCAVAVVNGGVGDTSSPYLYSGFVAVYEAGEELARHQASGDSITCTVDLDADILRAEKKSPPARTPSHTILPSETKQGLRRKLRHDPFLPQTDPGGYLRELFALQVRSLATRMENIGVTRLVIGVSGGLDSTAALLVSAAACDLLELPRTNIYGITMPGFGTSDRTYYNALALLEKLGVTRRDISIKAAVLQHFEDIGHGGRKDTTYENAQARERAQILLDLANAVGGIVVGTGDLSEEALGFCTFAGDHIANYNVNVCITKTMLRQLTRHVVQSGLVEGVTEVVLDILDTPVSPELLPTEESGEIKQKTEEILGPYLLHDFFLYYFVRYRFRPSKLYHYACTAFAGDLAPNFIREKLGLFLSRFCAGQFKRACAPDAASITGVNLCGVNFYIPSDLDPTALLRELAETPDL